MFKLFHRTPNARQMARMAHEAKRERYKTFHDQLAEQVGRKIEWAE